MKPFTIYKNSKLQKEDIWHVHARYKSMATAKQALRDLTKKPKDKRVWRYTILPTLSPERIIQIKPEHNKEILKTAR